MATLIGEYPKNPVGIILFGSIWVIIPLFIYLIGSRAYHKNYLHKSVDLNRYRFLRRMTLIYAPLSGLPILFAWSAPTVALFFYALMMMGGIIAGFLVKITEEDD